MGEVELAFGQSDEIAGMVRGDRERQCMRIGEADVFRGEDDEAASDEPRIFAAGEHFRQPVEGGVRVAAANAFDERGNRVVMFILIGVVADLPLGGERLQMVGRQRRSFWDTFHNDLKRIQRAAKITVAKTRESGEHVLVGDAPVTSQPALFVSERPLESRGNLIGRQRFESEQMAAADERRDDVKAGIVGCGTDQADETFFNIREEEILLRLVEAMDFVDEQDCLGVGTRTRGQEDLAEFGDVGLDGVDPDELAAGFAGDDARKAGFAAAGRPIEEKAAEPVSADQLNQKAVGTEEMRLADNFAEVARSHPRCERLTRGPRFGRCKVFRGPAFGREKIELVRIAHENCYVMPAGASAQGGMVFRALPEPPPRKLARGAKGTGARQVQREAHAPAGVSPDGFGQKSGHCNSGGRE